MRTHCILAIIFATSGIAHADDVAVKNAKAQAEEASQAFAKGDFDKLADLTYQPLIDFMGGRDKMIAATKAALNAAKEQKIEVVSYRTTEPGEIVKDGGKSYVVIPATMELKAPDATIRVKSYLLGISSDDGKTWKFLDGAGLNKELQNKVLPDLSAKVKLPGPVVPEIIKK